MKPQVRQYAVKALGKIGDFQALRTLYTIVENEQEKYYTREAAQNALRKIKN